MQGNAELYLEKLHGLAEKEPNAFAEGEAPIAAWPKFRENLIGLTDVTRSHFEKLVQARGRARLAPYHSPWLGPQTSCPCARAGARPSCAPRTVGLCQPHQLHGALM